MKILHLLSAGGIGGIEVLCRDISELSKDDNEFCFLFKGGEIAAQMIERGVPVHLLYRENKIKRLSRLIKLVRKNRYDVIIVHHEGFGIYFAYLLCRFFYPKAKYIKYLHCSFEPEYFYTGSARRDKVNYWILKKAMLLSDKIIAVSEFVKKSYENEFGIAEDRFIVIYNGIRITDCFYPQSRMSEDETINILYVGRLVYTKGAHILIGAVKRLNDKGYSVELNLLGDGVQRTEYEEQAERLEIKEKIHFRGYQLDKESFYQEAHIFCCPSVWQEAFGISLVEAMQRGLICVASNVGGIAEIITDEENGYLTEAGNEQRLADTLEKVILQYRGSDLMFMRNAAKKRAEEFSIDRMIRELTEIYREG